MRQIIILSAATWLLLTKPLVSMIPTLPDRHQCDQTLDEVLTYFPESTNVLKAYNIDGAFYGDVNLSAICKTMHIEEDALWWEILLQPRGDHSAEVADYDTDELIRYITIRHHTYIRNASFRIRRMLRITEAAPEGTQIHTVAYLFDLLADLLGYLMLREEEILFPYLKRECVHRTIRNERFLTNLSRTLEDVERDQRRAEELITRISETLDDYRAPIHCNDFFKLTIKLLKAFDIELRGHHQLENGVLYRRISMETASF